jgi:translation elongation factor P/translation initiation factor 5A
MKKLSRDLKKGDKIKIAEQTCLVEETEISEMGKQGKRKVRIAAMTEKGEKLVIIRPDDYPFESLG